MLKPLKIILITYVITISTSLNAEKWAPVPPVRISSISESDFSDDDLDLPYYLVNFHTVINSVVESGDNKGFINIPVWRRRSENIPVNARIMENILSFVWFYTQQRKWNPYYDMPEVKVRIEKAMDYLTSLQLPNGLYPDVPLKYRNGGMASTAFVTKFMGEAFVLLNNGPEIDKDVLQRFKNAQRKAIMELLNNDVHYNRAILYPNQYTNVFAGALAFLSVYPDQEMYDVLKRRIIQSADDIISPAGFFPEAYGVDFDYNLYTHFSNLWMCYHYSRGTELENYFLHEAEVFTDWIQYNAVLENNGVFTLNRAIETRKLINIIPETALFGVSPFGENVPQARAFQPSVEEITSATKALRKSLSKDWSVLRTFKRGEFDAYSPYVFLHRNHYKWYPTQAMKDNAIASLPYKTRKSFVHQRVHDARPYLFTFINRPSYYATFNSGQIASEQQRYGLGLIWHPQAGTIMQSQTATVDAAWGTMLLGGDFVYEAESLNAGFLSNCTLINPRAGVSTFLDDDFKIIYPLSNRGRKTIDFKNNSIEITLNHKGKFTEYLPLLVGENDKLEISGNKVLLRKNGVNIQIIFSEVNKITNLSDFTQESKLFDPARKLPYDSPPIELSSVKESIYCGENRVVVIRVDAENYLKYSFEM